MPEAGVKTAVERHELRTCEGGWIELRQLSYNEMLERRDGAMIVTQQMGVRDIPATVRFANQWSNEFSFKHCIVDHNLEFDGKKIDFQNPKIAMAQLDPKIGFEIELIIDNLNQEADRTEDFTTAPFLSSTDGVNEQQNSTEETSPS
jgi:hypothetical protein